MVHPRNQEEPVEVIRAYRAIALFRGGPGHPVAVVDTNGARDHSVGIPVAIQDLAAARAEQRRVVVVAADARAPGSTVSVNKTSLYVNWVWSHSVSL